MNPRDLAALDPAAAADLPAAEVPAVLTWIASEQHRLATLQGVLALRLTVPPAPTGNGAEYITDLDEVVRITRHSVSWLRKNGHRLPGFHQPGGKGTRVAWARAALEAWAARPTP